MAPTNQLVLRFIPQPYPSQSTRDRELLRSEQRSHAARVSHERRRHADVIESPKRLPSSKTVYEGSVKDTIQPRIQEGAENCKHRSLVSDDDIDVLSACNLTSQSPPPRLSRGNSDPFDSFAIRITPRVNQFIQFYRDEFLPGAYYSPFFRNCSVQTSKLTVVEECPIISSPAAVQGWNLAKLSLTNVGTATSFLATNILMASRSGSNPENPRFQRLGMKLLAFSSVHLRKHIAISLKSPQAKISQILLVQIWGLYRFECMKKDYPAAKIHEGVLYRLIEEIDQNWNFKCYMLLCLLYWAVDLSIAVMKKEACVYDPLCSRTLHFLEHRVNFLLTFLPDHYKDAHPSIQTPIRPILIRFRRMYAFSESILPEVLYNSDQKNILSYWCCLFTLVRGLDLLYIYNEIVEGSAGHLGSVGQQYTTAAVALTIVYINRICLDSLYVRGANVREGASDFVPRIRTALETSISYSTLSEQINNRDVYLWVLYTGSIHEMRTSPFSNKPDKWFTTELLDRARMTNITTWQELRLILRQFLYTDYLEPYGPLWFENSLRMSTPTISL